MAITYRKVRESRGGGIMVAIKEAVVSYHLRI